MPRVTKKKITNDTTASQRSIFEALGDSSLRGTTGGSDEAIQNREPIAGLLRSASSLPRNDSEERILGVGEFLDYVNQILKVTEDVKVVGEISEFKVLPSGVYLTLKDVQGDGVMDGYMNPYAYRGLGLQLDIGMQVKLSGFPAIYKPKGRFSFRIESVELAGEGSLKKAYDLLKAKLEAEGLFALERKRSLPENIQRIGIITSRTGAVIDDFRNNLEKLGLKVSLFDVRVEGNLAVSQIIKAFELVSKGSFDTIVIMRGGGSLEDLQAFNNELIVRAIFQSRVPVIAAIGHDRDVPLCCLVADTYTSTPTAAAVLINNSWQKLRTLVPQLERDIFYSYESALQEQKSNLRSLTQSLITHVQKILLKHTYLEGKIVNAIKTIGQRIQYIKAQVASTEQYFESNNPERNLKLGYSLVYNGNNRIIRTTDSLKVGDSVKVKLFKGTLDTTIDTIG